MMRKKITNNYRLIRPAHIFIVLVLCLCFLTIYGIASHTSAKADAGCTSSAPYGTDVLPSFSIPYTPGEPTSEPLEIWVHWKLTVQTPAIAAQFGLEVGNTCYIVGTPVPATSNSGGWFWSDETAANVFAAPPVPTMEQTFNIGQSYNVELFGTTPGISVDAVSFSNPSCIWGQATCPSASFTGTGSSTGTIPSPVLPGVISTGPSISITSPASGATVSGSSIPLSADVTDGATGSISQVSFGLENASGSTTSIGSTSSATNGLYSINWDASSIPAGSYTLVVSATDSGSNSTSMSEPITVSSGTCAAPPGMPLAFADTDTPPLPSNKVDLGWAAPSAINCIIDGYAILRSGGGQSVEFTPPGVNTSYTDSTVSPATTYTYQVEASNNSSSGTTIGTLSNPVTITTGASSTSTGSGGSGSTGSGGTTTTQCATPSTPQLSQGGATSSSITVDWTPSTPGSGCSISGYRLYRNGIEIPANGSVGPTATSYNDTGLSPGTAYSYTIMAFDSQGNLSATGGPIVFDTQANNVAPTQPTNFQALASSPTSVVLSWGASTALPANSSATITYNVYRNNNFNTPVCTTTSFACTNTSLTPNTTYSYTIEAVLGGNASAPVSNVSVTTPPTPTPTSTTCTTAPSAPTGLQSTAATPTSISLSWQASKTAANCAIYGYNVSRNNGTPTFVSQNTSNSGTFFTDTNLTPSTSYTYTVTACEVSYCSSNNPSISVKTAADTTAPSAPSNVIDSVLGPTEVQITWSASTDNVGVTGYNIYRNGSGTPIASVSGSTTSYLDQSGTPLTQYTYSVSAVDIAGNASAKTLAQPSPVTTLKTVTAAQPPTTPTGLKASLVTSNFVALMWNASASGSGVSGYNIYRNGTLVGTSGTAGYVDAQLTPNTQYNYSVKAFNSNGTLSASSNTASVTTLNSSLLGLQGILPSSFYLSFYSPSNVTPITPGSGASATVTTPVTIEPATVQSQGVNQVNYYLNNNLVATATAAPFAYNLNPTSMLNGNYTLTAKTIYRSGLIRSVTTHLRLASSLSASQLGLFFLHYILWPIIDIAVVVLAWLVIRRMTFIFSEAGKQSTEEETTVIHPTNKEP